MDSMPVIGTAHSVNTLARRLAMAMAIAVAIPIEVASQKTIRRSVERKGLSDYRDPKLQTAVGVFCKALEANRPGLSR